MKSFRFTLPALVCLIACSQSFAQQQASTELSAQQESFKSKILPFLAANCNVCHDAQKQSGGLNLAEFTTLDSFSKNHEEWKLVLERLQTGEMPPKTMPARSIPPGGLPNPTEESRQAVIKWLEAEFDRLDRTMKPSAGRVSARRLNRVEYNNTVQDLLGVKLWPANNFPQDDAAHGFDNVADGLTISPVLMEKYMTAAEKVAHEAVFGPEKLPPAVKKLEQLERDVTNITVVPKEYDESGITTDRAMNSMFHFPADGVYLFRVCARGFRPLDCDPLEVGLWLDGKLVKEMKVDPKQDDGPSLLGGRQDLFGKPQDYRMFVTAGDHWVGASVLRMFEGLPPIYNGPNPSKRKPTTAPVEVALQQAEREKLAQEEQQQQAAAPQTQPVAEAAPASQPAVVALAVAVDPQIAPASQPTTQQAAANGRRGGRGARGGRGGGRGRGGPAPIETQIGIDYVDIVGPYDQASGPTAESTAKLYPRPNMDRNDPNTPREILAHVANRAFRRPVTPAEVDRFVKLYDMVRKQGDSFEEALAVALQGILVSPDFLVRIEKDPPAGSADQEHTLSDHELATRLSYFLWSTMPDDELRAAADQGKLHEPEVLEAQVRRMLKDPRSHALAENFAGQWLRVRALESSTPDFKLFPDYDAYLGISMKQETDLFFDYIVHEDRPILDFVDAKYTFVNEKLAMLYGIKGIKGTEFRKVDLTGTPRAGVITQASVLTVSSYATRTSPVIRGKWILENILNAPPPAPPNNVPPLEDTIKNNPNATLRKQLEMHRENPTCAGCHARMDPLGMGLENFDAIGKWRTEDAKLPVDASGKLPDGRSFNGPTEMLAVLMADKNVFTECLAEKLLTYATGRGIESFDRPTVQQIVSKVSQDDYRFSRMILEIVNSLPFQKRAVAPAVAAADIGK